MEQMQDFSPPKAQAFICSELEQFDCLALHVNLYYLVTNNDLFSLSASPL